MAGASIDWRFVEQRMLELARRDDATAYSVGHIYRQVQQAAGSHCSGWPRLREYRAIFWWRHGSVTVFVAFHAENRTLILENRTLILLELTDGTRPQDFKLGAETAKQRFASL